MQRHEEHTRTCQVCEHAVLMHVYIHMPTPSISYFIAGLSLLLRVQRCTGNEHVHEIYIVAAHVPMN